MEECGKYSVDMQIYHISLTKKAWVTCHWSCDISPQCPLIPRKIL